MKKVFYSFVAAAMFVGVVACGQTEEAPVEEAAVEVVEEAPVVEEVAPVDAAPAEGEVAPAAEGEAAPAAPAQ